MAEQTAKQTIEQLQMEAHAAYQEFLKRLEKLEKERAAIVQDTLKQMDQKKIDDIRKKLGLQSN